MILELLIPCPGRDSADQQDRINQNRLKSDWDLQTLAGLVIPNPELCV